ncbi:Hypothetical predicted protein [Olea europaea subsp. europaea]|uniref:PAP/OAS1 substrate-binding-related domain-containing protein n=1 Tax=Olea europaea subsp. europaea TaxID=158383 RepID=A0A8S0RIJ0_OLEEU|nr:Hypothetical predicted protein [Olea europaea subsp. europaea]
MPLKTYLPHGDIDLTVIRSRDDKKPSPYYVLSLLMMTEQSENAEYEVQNSQLKNARDKIVKCSVEGIAVDISFNQFGGFRALCFLEQVLYGFLKYFSQFDWNTCCISLQGPVRISSLPDIVVEIPENEQKNRMLSEEFLKNWKENFQIHLGALRRNQKNFRKCILIDPLKENNNLGRSVSAGAFS